MKANNIRELPLPAFDLVVRPLVIKMGRMDRGSVQRAQEKTPRDIPGDFIYMKVGHHRLVEDTTSLYTWSHTNWLLSWKTKMKLDPYLKHVQK